MTTYNKDQEYTLKVANTAGEVKEIKYTPEKDMSKPELITALKSKYKNFFKLIESKGEDIKMEETKVAENQKVTISVKALFDKFGTILSNNNEIIAKDDYYDLINEDGVLVCADGEECSVQSVAGNTVTLTNFSGEKDVTFTLDLAEFKIATDITDLEEAKEDNTVIVLNYGEGTRFPSRDIAIEYYDECVAGTDPYSSENYSYQNILYELQHTDKPVVYDTDDDIEYDYWIKRGKPVKDISEELLQAHVKSYKKQEEDNDNKTVNGFVNKSLTELFNQFDLDGIDISDKDYDMLVYMARIDEPDISDSYEVYIHNLCNKLKVTSNFTEGDDVAIVDLTSYVQENKEALLDMFELDTAEDNDVIGDIVTEVMPNLISGYATESIYKELLKTLEEED